MVPLIVTTSRITALNSSMCQYIYQVADIARSIRPSHLLSVAGTFGFVLG